MFHLVLLKTFTLEDSEVAEISSRKSDKLQLVIKRRAKNNTQSFSLLLTGFGKSLVKNGESMVNGESQRVRGQ